MNQLGLVGEKVLLRQKVLSDVEDDYLWRSDPELAELDSAKPLDMKLSDYVRFFEDELRFENPWSIRFAIDSVQGLHIGNCMFYDINYISGKTELGILIGDRNYWSKGYGTEAVGLLLKYIFSFTPLNDVYLHTLDWNLRAQRSFKKCGFAPKKNVHRNGKIFILMEVTKVAWMESL
jgi:RimJ/RimL family protein N-acetyltransferase